MVIADTTQSLECQRALARGEHPLVIRALWNSICDSCRREMQHVGSDDLWHEHRYECSCGAVVEVSFGTLRKW
jgi:hypothetical protein